MVNHLVNSSGTLDTTNPIDLLQRAMDAIWVRENSAPQNLGRFFNKISASSGLNYQISNVGSETQLPPESEDTETLQYAVPAQGYNKDLTMQGYRLGIRVTDTLLKAERFPRVMQMTTGLVEAARRWDEFSYASIFNNAFTGTAGADDLSLCNSSHPPEDAEGSTWDNSSTGALTGATLQTARLLMRQITDARGDPMMIKPTALVIPEDLEQKALELIKSPQRAEDSLNATTQLISGLEVVVSLYLSSAVQFYLMGDMQGDEKGLYDVSLSDWSMADVGNATADVPINKRIKAIKVVDFTMSRNIVGSTGV
jgi:hypothetical protein